MSMKKIALLYLVALFTLSPEAHAVAETGSSIQWKNSFSAASSASEASSKPIVILFTGTNWCPACMMLERKVISQPAFAEAVGDKFVFLKADFPDYSNAATSPYKPLLDRYNITEFPSIVVTDASGQVLFRVRYKDGGPGAYAQELLRGLATTRS